MNPQEHELNYPWADVPAPGTLTTLRPGVHWLRMPLPFALDHINLWLLDDEIDGRAGFTAIDCGIASDDTRAAWERLFDTTFGGKPLLRVLSTHFHPDHLGLAYWLTQGGDKQRWQAPLWMTMSEYAMGRMLSMHKGDHAVEAGKRAAAHFAAHGLTDPAALDKIVARGTNHYPRLVPQVPASFRRLNDGDEVAIGAHGAKRLFRVIVGFGHAPEHVSLWCESDKLLVSGDMVLPRISTNVSVFEMEPEGNPLPRYLRSLDHYLMLAADALVLPSHGKPFIGLHRRVVQQHEHHQARLDEVLAACERPVDGVDITRVMFKRELDLHQMTFALGEALAHLHALWYDGKVERRRGDDGVYRFSRV